MATKTGELTIDDIEGNLILTLCLYPESFPISLRAEHFEDPVYQGMIAQMTKLKAQGKGWDMPLLYAEGSDRAKEYLRDVNPDWFVSTALISRYLELLKKNYRQKLSVQISNEIEDEFGFIDIFEFQARLNKKLAEDMTENQTITMKQATKIVYDHLEKANEDGGVTGVTTGMHGLNDYFNGFQPSRLYILAARPSMGKSALMLNLALNASKAGHTTYVHCLEESILSFCTRAFSNQTGIDNDLLQRGRISTGHWEKIHEGMSKLSTLPFYLNEQANLTPEQLCNGIRAHHLKFPIEIVFIDHIQEIKRKSDSWHHDISEAAGLFKQLAKDLKIPVVVVSQLSRQVEQSADKRPGLSHLKESGDIEAKADVVMLLYREAYYNIQADKSLAELTIAKNRDGRTGIFRLHWNPNEMKFGERLVE